MDISPPRLGIGLYFNRPAGPIPGTPLFDYDSLSIDGMNNSTLTDGQGIVQWKNLGSLGAGFDLNSPTTPLSDPFFRLIATPGKLNNLPAVESPGGKQLQRIFALSGQNQPLTWAWVWRAAAGTGPDITSGAGNFQRLQVVFPGIRFGAGLANIDPGVTVTPDTWESLIITADGAASNGTLNGTPFSMGNPGTDAENWLSFFESGGSSNDMIGFIARVIIWGVAPPSQATIAAYLDSIYGVNPQ